MGRILVLDDTNLPICQINQLYGVPNSSRAVKQLSAVKPGEPLLFYTTRSKRIYGVYRAESKAFLEPHPERGPWNSRQVDKRRGFYPFRIEIQPIEAYSQSLDMRELAKAGTGLTREAIAKGASVLYLDDNDIRALIRLLEKVNKNALRLNLTNTELEKIDT
jgi:hypothetical protein